MAAPTLLAGIFCQLLAGKKKKKKKEVSHGTNVGDLMLTHELVTHFVVYCHG